MDAYLPRNKGILNVVPFIGGRKFREIGVIHHFLQSQMPPSPEQLNNMILQSTTALENLIHGPNPMIYSNRDYSSLKGERLIPIVILVETQTVVHKYMPAPIEVGTAGNKWEDDEPPKAKKEKQSNTNEILLLL